MNYAIIENGICVNAIVADAQFATAVGAVALPDGFGVGDLYDGTTWCKAAPPAASQTPTEQDKINACLFLEIAKLKAGVSA